MVETLQKPTGQSTAKTPETVFIGDPIAHTILADEGSAVMHAGTLQEVSCDPQGCTVTLFDESGKLTTGKIKTEKTDLQEKLKNSIGGEVVASSAIFGQEDFFTLSVNTPVELPHLREFAAD